MKKEKNKELEPLKKPRKRMSPKTKKAIEWSITGFFLTVLAVVGGIKIYETVTKKSVLGVQYPVVLTDSMEPAYMTGDVLIVEEYKVDTLKEGDIKVGDDISFYYDIFYNGDKQMVTHRVKEVAYSVEGFKEIDGKMMHFQITTHGVNTKSNQGGGKEPVDCTKTYQIFYENDLIGKVKGTSPFLTFMHKVFSSVWTLILLVLIPALYIVITSIIDLFDTIKEPNVEASSDISEGEKQVVEVDAKAIPSNNEDPLADLSKEDIERLKKEMLDELINKGSEK